MNTLELTEDHLFIEAGNTHRCPKCCGLVEGPQWEGTLQGKVYTLHCVNCGWRANSRRYVIDYTMPKKELDIHITKMKHLTRPVIKIKVPRRLPLSAYNWEI